MADKLYEFAITFKTDDVAAIAALKRFQTQLVKTEQSKAGVSQEGKKLGGVIRDLTRGTTALGGPFSRLGALLRVLVSPVSLLTAGLAGLVAVTIKGSKAFMDAWDEAQRLKIILMNELSPSFSQIQNDLEKVAIQTGITFQSLLKDFKDLTRTTHDYDRSLRLVAEGAKLAAISGSELRDVTRASLRMTETFTDLKGKEAEIMDAMAYMYKKSETDIGVFAEAMGRVVPTVNASTAAWEEFVALTTAVLRITGKTSDAMTSLRTIFQLFGLEQKKTLDVGAEMGSLMGAQAIKAKGLTKTFEDLSKAIALSPNSFLRQLYRVFPALEAANVGSIILSKEGFAEYKKILEEVRNSQGTLNNMWGQTNSIWGIAFGRIRELAGAFTRHLGQALFENSGLVEWLNKQVTNNAETWARWGKNVGDFLVNVGRLIKGVIFVVKLLGRSFLVLGPIIYGLKMILFLIGKVSEFFGTLAGRKIAPSKELVTMAAMAPGAPKGPVAEHIPGLARPGGAPILPMPRHPKTEALMRRWAGEAPTTSTGEVVGAIKDLTTEVKHLATRPIRTDINIDGEKVARSVSRVVADDARERGESLPIGIESERAAGGIPLGVPTYATQAR